MIKQTLGNLGQTRHHCHQLEISFDKEFQPTCAKGKISKLEWVGLSPFRNDGLKTAYCGDPENIEDINICTQSFLNTDEFKIAFDES